MVTILSADENETLKLEVNRTTEKFLEYYISALESLHYISIDFKRIKYEDKERANKPLTFKESEEVRRKAYSRIKLEDLFQPNKWSTGFIELFDEVKLPYFDSSGKLSRSSPNSLLNEFYESLSLHGYGKFGFANRLEETMIVKGKALIKRNNSKADYSDGLIREELERLNNKMMEYFLSCTVMLYDEYCEPRINKGSNVSKEYFSIFNKIEIPLLQPAMISKGENFLGSKYEIKKQYLKFGEAICKKISGLRYDIHSIPYEDEKIRILSWVAGVNFARGTLQEMENKSNNSSG